MLHRIPKEINNLNLIQTYQPGGDSLFWGSNLECPYCSNALKDAGNKYGFYADNHWDCAEKYFNHPPNIYFCECESCRIETTRNYADVCHYFPSQVDLEDEGYFCQGCARNRCPETPSWVVVTPYVRKVAI